MSDCIFCKIANKEINSSIRYEDENVIAFDDVNPVTKIHILVIPKKHISSLNEVQDKNILIDIYNGIEKIAEQLGIKEDGYRVITNVGENAGQTVKHLHFHILAGQKLGEKLC